MLYLLDPTGASRRSRSLKAVDKLVHTFKWILRYEEQAVGLPYIPDFLKKKGGLVFSIGQFNQWVSSQLMATGLVQVFICTLLRKSARQGRKSATHHQNPQVISTHERKFKNSSFLT